jgi:DNA-binding SARP family transcriptional activator
MDFRLLGPLEVWHDDQAVPVRGAKQRALLALLLLHANQVVSSDRLLDELWGDEPPEARTAALRVRLSQLRKALDTGGEGPIVTRAPGYSIALQPDQLDLRRFERLLEQAAGAEPAAAAELLREALALWRGPVLADFAFEPFAQAAIGRLEELRLLAVERKVDADLALGRHGELVPELEELVAEHPLREGLRAQLMLALYRAGRQAEALDSYQKARRTLVDELGIEPSPALQELEKAILRQDPSLEVAQVQGARRSILVAGLAGRKLEPLLVVAEPLARDPSREVVVARLLEERAELGAASVEVAQLCKTLGEHGVVGRSAVFTSESPGADVTRLATEQDVDLVLVAAPPGLLDDADLATLLLGAPCDVALLLGDSAMPGPVLVPFGGTEHDWGAIELGAWLAGSWRVQLRLAGPAVEGGRDASRLLASASLAVQRALGVAAEPLLVEPGPEALVEAGREVAVTVVGLSDRWQKEGLGPVRAALAASGRPTLLVRKGLRPGGLAPTENLTRFTWSLRAG